MRRSKRNLESKSESMVDPSRNKNLKTHRSPISRGIHQKFINHQDPQGLLEHCFSQMTPYIWYTVIPSDSSSVDSMSFSIDQSWELLSPLLLHHKLISIREEKYSVNAKKWLELQHMGFDSIVLHFGNHRIKNCPRIYYICRDSPLYSSPLTQIKSGYAYTSLHNYSKRNRELKTALINFVGRILLPDLPRIFQKETGKNTDHDKITNAGSTADSTVTIPNVDAVLRRPEQKFLSPQIEERINLALSLNLRTTPRLSRYDSSIVIEKKPANQQATSVERILVLLTANRWGYNKSLSLPYRERMRILRAASRISAYDNGYSSEFSTSTIMRWELNINRKIDLGSSSEQMIQSMNMGSISEVEKIEDKYPGYLQCLYREAIKVYWF